MQPWCKLMTLGDFPFCPSTTINMEKVAVKLNKHLWCSNDKMYLKFEGYQIMFTHIIRHISSNFNMNKAKKFRNAIKVIFPAPTSHFLYKTFVDQVESRTLKG